MSFLTCHGWMFHVSFKQNLRLCYYNMAKIKSSLSQLHFSWLVFEKYIVDTYAPLLSFVLFFIILYIRQLLATFYVRFFQGNAAANSEDKLTSTSSAPTHMSFTALCVPPPLTYSMLFNYEAALIREGLEREWGGEN